MSLQDLLDDVMAEPMHLTHTGLAWRVVDSAQKAEDWALVCELLRLDTCVVRIDRPAALLREMEKVRAK